MHIAAIYFIQRQIAAQNRYNKRSYKKQVFTWRTISFLHEHLLFYLLFTGGINSGSQVFITDPTINPIVIYNNPVRHIAAIAAFPYDDTVGDIIHFFIICTGTFTHNQPMISSGVGTKAINSAKRYIWCNASIRQNNVGIVFGIILYLQQAPKAILFCPYAAIARGAKSSYCPAEIITLP